MTKNNNNMTLKQKKFVKKYLETGNGTQAALEAYNTANTNVAANIASENLRKPYIQEEINRLLNVNNLSLEKNLENIASIANLTPETRVTADQVLKANLESLRLRGADQGRKTQHTTFSLKAELSNMSYSELLESYKKRDREIKELMGE